MIALNTGDKIQGICSVASKMDYTISGIIRDNAIQMGDGQLPSALGDLYTAPDKAEISSIILVNTDTSTRTVNLYLLPAGGSTRRLIAKDLIMGIGYSLHFDGGNIKIIDTYGKEMTGTAEVTDTRLYELGTPELADVDKVVTVANMKVGTYTIAASPDIPRNVTVTHAQVGDVTDTLGTIVFVGTDIDDEALTETLTPSEDTIVSGVKAFKTVTSATGVGWVINTTEDTVTIGQGNELGLPVALPTVYYMLLGMLDFTMLAHNPTTDTTLAGTTVDMSAGTYDGSKTAKVVVTD